jgi:signal transduction histidine kinase
MTLTATPIAATLDVVNELAGVGDQPVADGRGLRGMKQRVELLGGTIDIGPRQNTWTVHVSVPSSADVTDSSTRMHTS